MNNDAQAPNPPQEWPKLRIPHTNPERNRNNKSTRNSTEALRLSLTDTDTPVNARQTNNNIAPPAIHQQHEEAGTPLQSEHFKDLASAKLRAKKITRAASVANFNAWSAAIMASFSLLFALFSIPSAVIGIALAYIAYQEFKGRKMLRGFQINAAAHLGWNQVIFAVMIIVYASWGIYQAFSTPAMSAQYAQYGPEVQNMMQPYDSIYSTANLLVYAGVGLFGIIFQGGTALYYFTRKKYIQSYLRETPDWIVELQKQNP